MFFTLFGYWVWGGVSQGIVTQPAYAVFHSGELKNRSFQNLFFSYCDHLKSPSMLSKACFRPYLGVFHPIWVLGWGAEGLPRDWYTTCLCNFSLWTAQKSRFSKLVFLIILTTQYDHPSYLKHILGRIYMFFTLFGYWVGGGGLPRDWYTTCWCVNRSMCSCTYTCEQSI